MPPPKRSVLRIAALATLLLLPIAACTDAATPTPDPYAVATPIYDVELARETLASARERWEANGSADYSYQAVHECFCTYGGDSFKVTVRNDAVYSVVHVDTGTWLNRDDYASYSGPFATIDDLLDEIDSLLQPSSPAFWLSVNYHPTLGYPVYKNSDAAYNTVDDGFGVDVTAYEPIAADAPPAPTPTPAYKAMAELAAAEALWRARGSDDYTIEYTVFVRPRGDMPLRLTVRNEVLESITSLSKSYYSQPVTLDDWYITEALRWAPSPLPMALTIDGLFDMVETALRERQSELESYSSRWWNTHWGVRVAYDPDWGYPREFTVTGYRGGETTEWFDATLRNYEPLDPPSTAPATPTPETSALPHGQLERHASVMDLFSDGGAVTALSIGPAATVEDVLEKGLFLAEASPVHLAVRGTAAADSARCEWRGIARTASQREDAIRYWLGLDEADAIPDAAYLEALFTATIAVLEPEYEETAYANFLAIVRGGLSTEYLYLTCHMDYAPSEYLLGAGPLAPAVLSVAYDRRAEAPSYALYRKEHDGGVFGSEPLMSEGEYRGHLDGMVQREEFLLAATYSGRECVVFLAPMGAHNAIAVEAWQAVAHWDVLTDDDGVVQAVRYGTYEGDPEHTQTLANLKSRITAAVSPPSEGAGGASTDPAPSPQPARIPNASGLTQYYRDLGAYGDITPDDGQTTTFTPSQPPETYTCASGTAVASPTADIGLVHDCEALVDGKDALRGTGSLNWAAETAISNWDGVTTAGTPSRVTKVLLPNKSLTGSIPAGLGALFELTHLNLSGNSLTGDVPAELGWLHNLQELRLSGNSLTGCLPIALRSVAANDLSSLSLLYCRPPAPGAPTAGTAAETIVPLSWTAVANTAGYRVEYRQGDSGYWTVDDETLTTTSHTVDGLMCGTEHQFRLSAYGGGTEFAAAWSDPSDALTAPTAACVTPAFGEDSYAFAVAEDAAVGATVGAALAADPNGDALTYAIASGNEEGKFAIHSGTGAISVAAALDHETTDEYTLTVEARDGANTATAAVAIAVTDANDAPAFAQASYTFSIAESAPARRTVGTVTATDQDESGAVLYHITAGDASGRFTIDGSSGSILVRQALDYETTSSYTLTIEARDGKGGVDSTTVEIRMTNVPEGTPAAPEDVTLSLADGVFTITWSAVADAADYRVQRRTGGAGESWANMDAATGASRTFTPEGGPACGTTYEFRVQARGDGVVHVAAWGAASEAASHTTAACNRAPAFAASGYVFTVPENAAVGAVSYAITAGNDAGHFAIGGSTGTITVAGALDREGTASYTLTLQASDGKGVVVAASAPVTVTAVPSNSPASPQNLTAAAVGAGAEVRLSWDAPANAIVSGYQILRRRPNQGETLLLVHVENTLNAATTYVDRVNVEPGAKYVYRVKAINAAGVGPSSLPAQVNPVSGTGESS